MLKEAVLKIYYKQNGVLKSEEQGKFYLLGNKPTFLADMTPAKLWRNYNGYSIAKQILEAFSKVKIRPQIIYRVKEKNILYYSTPSYFTKYGILVPYGSHQQYVLPLRKWHAKDEPIWEPFNLRVMNLNDWIKGEEKKEKVKSDSFYIGYSARQKLAEIWRTKYV